MSEIEAMADELVDAALNATVPGGSNVWVWLPQKDAWTPHQTARNVMRCAITAALAALRETHHLIPTDQEPGGWRVVGPASRGGCMTHRRLTEKEKAAGWTEQALYSLEKRHD
jgi:hypothetical protein